MFKEYDEYLDEVKKNKSKHTFRAYKRSLDGFASYFNTSNVLEIDNISANDLREYRNILSGTGVANSTVNAHFRNISAFWNWLYNFEYIEKPPSITKLRSMKVPKKAIVSLTKEEVLGMINSCKTTQEKLMLTLMFHTGLRRGEVVKIKLSDINERRLVVKGKGDRDRVLMLTDDVLSLITEHMSSRKSDSEFLFTAKGHKGSISPEAVRQRVKKAARNAGISEDRVSKISSHTLRKTFATNLLENGVQVDVIQKALGHSSITTTINHYAKTLNKTVDEAMLSQKSFS